MKRYRSKKVSDGYMQHIGKGYLNIRPYGTRAVYTRGFVQILWDVHKYSRTNKRLHVRGSSFMDYSLGVLCNFYQLYFGDGGCNPHKQKISSLAVGKCIRASTNCCDKRLPFTF